MITSDTKILEQASLFRKMRALCRTMRKTDWEFRYDLYGTSASTFLRQKDQEDSCPLTFTWFVASGQFYHSRDWEPVSRKLGFKLHEAEKIIMSADHGNSKTVMASKTCKRMRRILLRAAGLKEQG